MDIKSKTPSYWITSRARTATVLFLAGFSTPAFLLAAGLNGNLSLSSDGTETIAVNGSMIDFDYSGGVTNTFPPTATGSVDGSGDSGLFDVTAASTSSFAGLIGTTVTVHDLDASQQPTGTTSGPGLPLGSFMTFAAQPGWSITLTQILPGTLGSAGCFDPAGIRCSPPGSPFNLQNEAGNQVLVGFAFLGIARDGLGNISYAAGTFSTTFSNTTYQQMLADLNNGEAVVSSAVATVAVSFQQIPPQTSYLVRYAANLNVGESYVDITNTGANGCSALGPGFGAAAGNICANVYTFDPGEELISCCSCLLTCAQTVNLGVNRDLTSNTLTGAPPTSVTIKVLASLAGGDGTGTSCTNSAAAVAPATLAGGLAAWGTTLHAGPGGSYGTTETPFTGSTLSIGELSSIGGRCASIIGNASGFGICSSCRAGALGGLKLSQ